MKTTSKLKGDSWSKPLPMPTTKQLENVYIKRGLSGDQAAEAFGVSKTTFFRWLRRRGVKVRPGFHYGGSGGFKGCKSNAPIRPCPLKKAELRALVNYYPEKAIFKLFGFHKRSVVRWCEEKNLTIPVFTSAKEKRSPYANKKKKPKVLVELEKRLK